MKRATTTSESEKVKSDESENLNSNKIIKLVSPTLKPKVNGDGNSLSEKLSLLKKPAVELPHLPSVSAPLVDPILFLERGNEDENIWYQKARENIVEINSGDFVEFCQVHEIVEELLSRWRSERAKYISVLKQYERCFKDSESKYLEVFASYANQVQMKQKTLLEKYKTQIQQQTDHQNREVSKHETEEFAIQELTLKVNELTRERDLLYSKNEALLESLKIQIGEYHTLEDLLKQPNDSEQRVKELESRIEEIQKLHKSEVDLLKGIIESNQHELELEMAHSQAKEQTIDSQAKIFLNEIKMLKKMKANTETDIKLEEIQQQVDELSASKRILENQSTQLSYKCKYLEENLREKTEEQIENLNKIAELTEKLEEKDQHIGKLVNLIQNNETEKENDLSTGEVSILGLSLKEKVDENVQLAERAEMLEQEVIEKTHELGELFQTVSGMQLQYQEARLLIDHQKNLIDQQYKKIHELQGQLTDTQIVYARHAKDTEDLGKQFLNIGTILDQLRDEKQQLITEKKELCQLLEKTANSIDQQADDNKDLKGQLQNLRKEYEEVVEDLHKKMDDMEKEHVERLNERDAKFEELSEQMGKKELKIIRIKERLSQKDEVIKQLQGEVDIINTQLEDNDEIKEELQVLTESNKIKDKELLSFKNSVLQIEKEQNSIIQSLNDKVARLTTQFKEIEKRNEELKGTLHQKKNELADVIQTCEDQRTALDIVQKELTEANKKLQQSDIKIETQEEELKLVKSKNTTLGKQVQSLNSKIEEKIEEIEELAKQLQSSHQQCDQAEDRLCEKEKENADTMEKLQYTLNKCHQIRSEMESQSNLEKKLQQLELNLKQCSSIILQLNDEKLLLEKALEEERVLAGQAQKEIVEEYNSAIYAQQKELEMLYSIVNETKNQTSEVELKQKNLIDQLEMQLESLLVEIKQKDQLIAMQEADISSRQHILNNQEKISSELLRERDELFEIIKEQDDLDKYVKAVEHEKQDLNASFKYIEKLSQTQQFIAEAGIELDTLSNDLVSRSRELKEEKRRRDKLLRMKLMQLDLSRRSMKLHESLNSSFEL